MLVAPGKLVSVCSMNMQFRREVTPATYQLPMHVKVLPSGVIDRYGDIWGGFVLKTLTDLAGDGLAAGEPMIEHLKEGDYVRNIWQENLCHQVNDEFLDLLAETRETFAPGDYLDMMAQLAETFRARTRAAHRSWRPICSIWRPRSTPGSNRCASSGTFASRASFSN